MILFREYLKTSKLKEIHPDILKRTTETLCELILFLHKEGSLTEFFEDDGISITPRQRLLKDFKIIELCTEILYYPFFMGNQNLNDIDPSLIDHFKLCYRLIKHTIKEYRPNEIYSS